MHPVSGFVAGSALGAWIRREDKPLHEIAETFKSLQDVARMRKGAPGVFTSKAVARVRPGFEKKTGSKGRGTPKDKLPPKEKDKVKPGGGEDKLHVYYYADGKFSIGTNLYDWPGICEHFGWDPASVCGPFVICKKAPKEQCRDSSHRDSCLLYTSPSPRDS